MKETYYKKKRSYSTQKRSGSNFECVPTGRFVAGVSNHAGQVSEPVSALGHNIFMLSNQGHHLNVLILNPYIDKYSVKQKKLYETDAV